MNSKSDIQTQTGMFVNEKRAKKTADCLCSTVGKLDCIDQSFHILPVFILLILNGKNKDALHRLSEPEVAVLM